MDYIMYSKKRNGVIFDVLRESINPEEVDNYIEWADSQIDQAEEQFMSSLDIDDVDELIDAKTEWWLQYISSDDWPSWKKYRGV